MIDLHEKYILGFDQGRDIPVTLPHEDRLQHLYTIGKSGTGKSTFLLNLIQQDIHTGKGFCVIDPHGDLAEDVLGLVPQKRAHDVIYFDATDQERPRGFNLLAGVREEDFARTAENITASFRSAFKDSWGDRLNYILENTVFALLYCKGSSLAWIPKFLHDKSFRMACLKEVKNDLVVHYFLHVFDSWPARQRADALSPVDNKIGSVLLNPALAHIFAQKDSRFDLREIFDDSRIFVVNLAKGQIGERSSKLLGSLLVSAMSQTALSRDDIAEDKRKPFYLYADEFSSYPSHAFHTILAEARKYGLGLILSQQVTVQTDRELVENILGNVGTLVAFRTGATDAYKLSVQLNLEVKETMVSSYDSLAYLSNYEAQVQALSDGVPQKTVHIETYDPPKVRMDWKEKRKRDSQERYGRKKAYPKQVLKELYGR